MTDGALMDENVDDLKSIVNNLLSETNIENGIQELEPLQSMDPGYTKCKVGSSDPTEPMNFDELLSKDVSNESISLEDILNFTDDHPRSWGQSESHRVVPGSISNCNKKRALAMKFSNNSHESRYSKELRRCDCDRNMKETAVITPTSLSPLSDSSNFFGCDPNTIARKSETVCGLSETEHHGRMQNSMAFGDISSKQTAQMNKHITDTQKLLENFQIVKDGYVRTSISLKNSMLALRHCEISRSHLYSENQQLLDQNKTLKQRVKDLESSLSRFTSQI